LGSWPNVSYAHFAKASFTPDLESVAASQDVRLVDVAEVLREEPTDS